MNNLKSYTEYAVSTPTTDFVIGFDFNYGTDAVNVTVDDVPATEAGYSVIYLNSTTMRLSPAVPSGVVRLQRETDIDVPDNQFTAGAKFIASNMDENFTQIRHAQQEVRDGFEKLSEDTYEIIDTLQDVGQAAQDAADAAEQAAELANDAAAQVSDKVPKSATLPTYLTVAAGVDPVTGVVEGAYFNVRSAGDDAVAIEYQNVSGSAVATGKSYPSSNAKWNASSIVDGDKNQHQINNDQLKHKIEVDNQFILVERFKEGSDNYIDDALDAIKADLVAKGAMSGGTLMLPRGIWRISRSHDLSVTGLRLCGDGGRYASRLVADADGDYSAGYVLKIAPTTGQVISGGSGLEKVTIDLNEAPAIGLIYQGAYDVSALDRAEVINGHKDYPCAIIEPHPNGTVIQTLKLDTSGFSKKSVGGTGYVVEIRMAQECIIINSKMFGSPSNQATKGSVPLLLENCRGIQIVGGGFANSETNCIHIYAKTRNTTHVTIIGPTFEGYKAKAIKTFAESGFTVSRLVTMNERMITPSAGLLEGGSLTFSTIYACNADIELLAGSTNNVIHTFDKSKVVDNGTYNEIIETPSSLNGNTHVSNRSQAAVMTTTPQFVLGVVGRTGNYAFRWDASATVDSGASFMTPNGSKPIRLSDDRIGFFASAPVTQRISPLTTATDPQKIAAIILGLEQLGLFKPAT